MNKYYGPDLKAQIVLSYLGGKTVSELARENNVSRSTIYIWIKEHNEQYATTRSMFIVFPPSQFDSPW